MKEYYKRLSEFKNKTYEYYLENPDFKDEAYQMLGDLWFLMRNDGDSPSTHYDVKYKESFRKINNLTQDYLKGNSDDLDSLFERWKESMNTIIDIYNNDDKIKKGTDGFINPPVNKVES